MMTLKEHEKLMKILLDRPNIGRSMRRNGIECPTCKKELYDTNPNIMVCSSPPQTDIHCEGCNYRGTRTTYFARNMEIVL